MEHLTAARPSNPDQSELASNSVNSLAARGTKALVPDVCVGELVQVVVEKRLDVDLGHLLKELKKGKIGVGHVREADLRLYSSLVPKIMKSDKLLESTDVRILALSIADRDCHGLLTFERKLIDSIGLRKFIESEVNFKRRHLITDDPFRR